MFIFLLSYARCSCLPPTNAMVQEVTIRGVSQRILFILAFFVSRFGCSYFPFCRHSLIVPYISTPFAQLTAAVTALISFFPPGLSVRYFHHVPRVCTTRMRATPSSCCFSASAASGRLRQPANQLVSSLPLLAPRGKESASLQHFPSQLTQLLC